MLKSYPATEAAAFRRLAEDNWKLIPVEANLPWGLSKRYLDGEGLYRMLAGNNYDGTTLIGVQTEASRPLILTGPDRVSAEIVEEIRNIDPQLPGLVARYELAQSFLSHWPEKPDYAMSMWLYCLDEVKLPTGITGRLQSPDQTHMELLADWLKGFTTDIKEIGGKQDFQQRARDLIEAGNVFLYVANGEPVSMVGSTRSAGGVACINHVYTPPRLRGRGYGTKGVGLLCQQLLEQHEQCCLYAEEDNPISNHVYRKLGFYVHSRSLEVSWSGLTK